MLVKEFKDISSLFDSSVWVEGRELYWYHKAWDCLLKNGLTSYNNREEECIVILRVACLNMIYREFCELALDEFYEYVGINEAFCEEISDFELGQLYAKFTDEDFITDDDNNKDDIWFALVEQQRDIVFNALHSEMDTMTMFFGMLLTSQTPKCWYEDDQDETPFCFRNTKIKSYEDYWQHIANDTDDYIDEFRFRDMDTLSWLDEGTYKIHLL